MAGNTPIPRVEEFELRKKDGRIYELWGADLPDGTVFACNRSISEADAQAAYEVVFEKAKRKIQ